MYEKCWEKALKNQAEVEAVYPHSGQTGVSGANRALSRSLEQNHLLQP